MTLHFMVMSAFDPLHAVYIFPVPFPTVDVEVTSHERHTYGAALDLSFYIHFGYIKSPADEHAP